MTDTDENSVMLRIIRFQVFEVISKHLGSKAKKYRHQEANYFLDRHKVYCLSSLALRRVPLILRGQLPISEL